jgi:dihydroneopterin aldolase
LEACRVERIVIDGIVAHGRHGAYEEERRHSQPFHLSLELRADLSAAGASDALSDTIDYARVYDAVVRIVEERSFSLIERLAAEILDEVMSDSRVLSASVSIAKPNLLDGATPRVIVTRERSRN